MLYFFSNFFLVNRVVVVALLVIVKCNIFRGGLCCTFSNV